MATVPWTMSYNETAVFHLPRFNSDHLPILIRTKPKPIRTNKSFRCENWWILKEGFSEVCQKVASYGDSDWRLTKKFFKREVKEWLGNSPTPDKMLSNIEEEMKVCNSSKQSNEVIQKEKKLEIEHNRILLMRERYWHQRARVNWALFGDNNTRFFHIAAVTRKRRNQIRALIGFDGEWVTEEKELRNLFICHFKGIYKKVQVQLISEVYSQEIFQDVSGVPSAAHSHLDSIPSDQEIFRALKSLGPNKAVGPDGFTAGLLQDNWAHFGPSIINEVRAFFISGQMAASLGRTNLVLIPKKEEAVHVSDFRPISVCNVLYKLISKILTLRLKPFIGLCISRAQSAFLPGREISENVILLREVLHSFGLSTYRNKEFCLKLDLSKAFDRMDWGFIKSLMPIYNFPPKFAHWIMSCITSAQFSIVLNGKSDGFFTPECGLRQGCSLSPYIFILGMDVLSRSLAYRVQTRELREVRIAPLADPLTDCLYADDLLLFGEASMAEAQHIISAVQDFSYVSGQRVGPEKSSIWYSAQTPQGTRDAISSFLMVQNSSPCKNYLGAPIGTNRQAFDFLTEKFANKLQMWQSRVLSPAGRLVLIRAVLQALPIYYMATTRIPKSVTNEITSLIRRFFWGKTGQQRFLAYVAWDKITEPLEEGGLGLRDLNAMNEALLMKFLWRLAAGSEALWVKVVKAKYMPRSDLWHSKRDYRCTLFWKSLMQLRTSLKPWVQWKIGNGELCTAFAQPWFRGALECSPGDGSQRRLRVNDLIDVQTGTWDLDKLIQLFGYQNCMEIITHVDPPASWNSIDRFVFSQTSNGEFSVKAGYNVLKESRNAVAVGSKELWEVVWHKGDVLPRICLFFWKLIQGALPLAKILSRRFSSHNPICQTCGCQEEDALHLLHRCQFSRACFLAGPLGLRSDELQGSLTQVLLQVAGKLNDEQWLLYVNSVWALWRCRNDRAYASELPDYQRFTNYFNSVNWESRIGASCRYCALTGRSSPIASLSEIRTDYNGYLDGSWLENWHGGVGIVLWHKEELIEYRSKAVQGCCALQIEAVALKEALSLVIGLGIDTCSFFSDCLELVNICSNQAPPINADWRAFDEILEVWNILQENKSLICLHVQRSHNELADNLAKTGRANGWDCSGFTFPCFKQ